MKTIRFTKIIVTVFSLAALASGLAEDNKAADPKSPTTEQEPGVSAAQWTDVKDITYDLRARFFAGLKQLEARVDSQISELSARRAAMTSTANTKDWDFAMKEMVNARSYLKSTGEVLAKATPETWSQEKEKVGQAWVRTQEAYAKVKASTTT